MKKKKLSLNQLSIACLNNINSINGGKKSGKEGPCGFGNTNADTKEDNCVSKNPKEDDVCVI